ncbi:50S ribosomal protein L25/general stress protein Ctc [Planococcus sp. FY231025]|uniref:50S ribosomal protein L25/general stress protein Ctc n=1 Tax=Planococcus sp. FY231025 TaxID=3455699 RepID=UPI003F9097F7
MSTKISAQKREAGTPHSTLTNLRGKGDVPGVVYGYQTETISVSVSETDLIKTLRESGRNGVINLEVEGKTLNVVLSDFQRDALKGSFKHVDFLAVNMAEELEVSVAVHTTGEAAGEKEGGVVNQPNREVTIKVKPSDIPDSLDIDVSELAIGDHISVGDIRGTVSYEILDEDDFLLVSVTAPTVEAEPEETDEEAEPEVIGSKEESEGSEEA